MTTNDRLSETTTVRLLNAWKAKKGIDTDYRAAKDLGTSHGTPGNWRHGRSHAAPALAARMAKDLDMDVIQVLAAIEADRAHNADDRRVWQRYGRGAFVALVLATSTVSPLRAAQAPGPLLPQEGSQTIHVSDHYAKWNMGSHGTPTGSFCAGVSFLNSCPFSSDRAPH